MYESFYNLNAKPFALSPDPYFYFGSKEHNRVLAYLRYGINQAEGFIVVTGDVGAGKTTLVRALLEELADNRDIITSQLVTTQLEPDDLLRMVASSFGLKQEGLQKATILRNLEAFLQQQSRAGKRVLLVVDEAQNLLPHSLEELRMLSNFQIGNRSLLQSFMLGQGEFRDTLRSDTLEQFRQRIIASYHLGPMGLDETRGYIEHRMHVVGWDNDPTFTHGAFAEIFNYSGGIPRRINTLCDRVLLYSYLEELHEISDKTVKDVIRELSEELPYSDTTDAGSADVTAVPSMAASRKHAKKNSSAGSAAGPGDLEQRVEKLEQIVEQFRGLIKLLID